MSALKKSTSTSKSTSKKAASSSSKKDNGAAPKNAKGQTSVKAKAKFAGGLAVAAKGTPPHTPTPPKQAPKPKTKKTGVADASVMGQNPASEHGADQATPASSFTGGGAGALKGAKSETSKAAKKVTKQKPSKILKAYKGLGKQVTTAKKKDEGKAHNAIPDFHAVLPGDAAMEAKGKKQNTKADTKVDDTVGGSEAKAPKLTKQKKGKATRQKVDSKSSAEMKRLAALEDAMDAIKSMFANMTAGIDTDSNVNTDPGPAPEIVFSGKSNPQRADKANTDASETINAGHEKFAEAIDKGKQPGDVERLEIDDVTSAVKNADLKIGEEQLQEGEKYYQKLVKQHTAQEIDGADALLEGEVQAKMGKANNDMDKVLLKQETERQKSVEKAKTDIDSKNLEAKAEQEKIVGKSKKDIAKAQKETRKKQDSEVKKAKRKGDKERRKVEKDIDTKEKKDEKKIVKEYDKAEKKADNEEKKAEAKARKKKKEAEKKKKESSWWDRVKSAVGDFVDSVCSAIGSIFDALGSLVSGILNAVKDLACSLIDAAISWAKKALDALGGMLKGLVNGLIGDLFPELAKKLNEAIDSGIELAKKGCDVVGEKLKEGVTAAVDTVNAVVQKGLQVAKVGLQTAVRVTGCIATGDFEGAFLATFYGALEIAGVSKADADKMLGDAKETLKLIVDKPGDFAGNLIKAGKDGFVNFGANFLGHFTSAVTGWLLGPVAAAGLKAPEEWNAQGIFGMVMGVLGVDGDSLKGMAAERIGEDNMAALEKAYEYVTGFIEGGFEGLWDQLKGDLSNIWDLVLGMITDYITKKVVQFGMEQLASLLAGPLGALWQALKTAWGIYCTIRDKINEIKEVLGAVFSSISDIARGNTTKASAWVEGALQKVLGIAIDLGANLAGIGDIPDKIRGFVEGLQERVKTAIGKAMDWVLEKVKGLFAGGKDEKKDKKEEDAAAPEPARTLPEDQPIAWQGGLINLSWSQTPSILLNATGKYPGVSSKAIDNMIADVKKTPDTAKRKEALAKLKAAKGSAASVMSKAGKWIQSGEGSREALNKQTGEIGALILDGLLPLDTIEKASGESGPDQALTHEIGKIVPFEAAGEKHRVFIAVNGNDAEVMVASRVKKAREHLNDFQTIVTGASFKGDKDECGQFIKKGRQLAGVTDKAADDALGGKGSVSAVVADQKSLGDVFKKLFTATASRQEKKVREILRKRIDTKDKEQLPTFLMLRKAGMSETEANSIGVNDLIKEGRQLWRKSLPTDRDFFKDVAKAAGDTIATRKLEEFDKEHQSGAKKEFAKFFKAAVAKWESPFRGGGTPIFALLQEVKGYGYGGLGDTVKIDDKMVYRVNNGKSFWEQAVTPAYKESLRRELVRAGELAPSAVVDMKATDSPVFIKWAEKSSNGRKLPSDEFDGSKTATYSKSGWWSNDKRYLEPAKAGIKENDAFAELCKIGALAPEWYPAGFVQLQMKPAKFDFRRPSVFDGLMSPLWVQQSPDEYAATGGGAREFLSQQEVTFGQCDALLAHIVTQDLQTALKKSGKNQAVNDYSEDALKTPKGRSNAEKFAGKAKKDMAEATIENREKANNLLEHLQQRENTALSIEPGLASALKKAPAPAGTDRLPKTLTPIFNARPSLKNLFNETSGEGKSLAASLKTIKVKAEFAGGPPVDRDFEGGYYTDVRKAVQSELKTRVLEPTILKAVLVRKSPKLSNESKTHLRTWLKKQDGGSVANKPEYEANRKQFEKRLGKLAEKHPKAMGTGQKMAKKAYDYMAAKAALSDKQRVELDQKILSIEDMLKQSGTDIKSIWAGRVGNTDKAIDALRGIFKDGKGNIRELFTQVNNFCERILGDDLLNASDATVATLISQADLEASEITKTRAQIDAKYGTVRDSTGKNIGSQVSGDEINKSANGDATVKGKNDTRLRRDPNTNRAQTVSFSKDTKLESKDAVSLNKREAALKGLSKKHLPWVEGAQVWDQNEENKWVSEARKMNMPLAGGISGTTVRMMNNHKILKPGTPIEDMRLAAFGYLIPIKAHSFHEIAVSARAHGVSYTDGVYNPLAPLNSGEIDKLKPIPDKKGKV